MTFVEDGYEVCVCCKKITDVPADRPIEERKWYIEGVGQLCESCAGFLGYSE